MATSIRSFQKIVWDYYKLHARALPWRIPGPDGIFEPYKILISEIMLQQTQATRVIPKYETFLSQFPTLESLAGAKLADVIRAWSGLGYNRRAKFLHEAAKIIARDHRSIVPASPEQLAELPGIGPNTAGAICVYAFDQPRVFIETNIRTVFIHHFFASQTNVEDKSIVPLVEKSLDGQDPRDFYWALMDYGTYLKAVAGNASRRSKSYRPQPAFKGSRRQLRGAILRLLAEKDMSLSQIEALTADARAYEVVEILEREGFVMRRGRHYHLA